MPPRPHNNCYWVVPGRLIAGEYPSAPKPDAARQKLSAILAAGVGHFIDLTERHDMIAPYDQLLKTLAPPSAGAAGYDRFAIPDAGVPESPAFTSAILDRIDGVIAAGRVPYVHCWGGIGRTQSRTTFARTLRGIFADNLASHSSGLPERNPTIKRAQPIRRSKK